MGLITDASPNAALEKLKSTQTYDDTDFVETVTTKGPYAWGFSGVESVEAPTEGFKYRLAVLDCGLKYNILRRFAAAGCRCIVLPATTSSEEILSWKPDGVLLSPGPGDPARLEPVI